MDKSFSCMSVSIVASRIDLSLACSSKLDNENEAVAVIKAADRVCDYNVFHGDEALASLFTAQM